MSDVLTGVVAFMAVAAFLVMVLPPLMIGHTRCCVSGRCSTRVRKARSSAHRVAPRHS